MQPISELHKAARAYAEAGIPVFPVEVNGKKPVTPNGFYDATTEIEKIDQWWKDTPFNVAFCPDNSGLVVIDLDPGAELELPPTYTVQTPRGRHYYYEGEGPTTASKIAPHVDTRGQGGYVLLPPSNIDGRKYEPLNSLSYAPIPKWISEALAKTETKLIAPVSEKDLPINIGRATDVLRKHVEQGKVAIEGQGGDAFTYRICCEVLDFGLSPETAFEILEEIWNPHCCPPWTAEELANKIQNAASYQQNEAGAHAIEPPDKVFSQAIARLFPIKRSRFYFKDESEQENEPDPQWIIKDLISERSTVLLYGATQSYKSFLTLDIALSIATGSDTFGAPALPGQVFYCALEGKAHLKKARRSWKIAKGISGRIENFFLGLAPLVGVPNEIEEFCEEIKNRCGQRNPKLIVIDTLSKAMAGLNENDAADAGQFLRFCDALVEKFGCSVVAIHHTGKDFAKGARGSSAFHAGFDTVIEIRAKRETKAVSVTVQKHKDAEEKETPWTFEGRVIGGSLVFFPTTQKEHYTLTNEQSEYSPRKIGAALKKLNAYGADHALTTNVLAQEITERVENQSDESHQIAISRAARALHRAAKEDLEAYTVQNGKQTMWALPAEG